jgi:hypothetical protein
MSKINQQQVQAQDDLFELDSSSNTNQEISANREKLIIKSIVLPSTLTAIAGDAVGTNFTDSSQCHSFDASTELSTGETIFTEYLEGTYPTHRYDDCQPSKLCTPRFDPFSDL